MPRRNKNINFKGILLNQYSYFIIGLIVITSISVTVFNNVRQQNEISQEIKDLESEINDLENSNLELKELIDYLESDQFAEEQAKLNLNYKKEGEEVAIIKPPENTINLDKSNKSLYNNGKEKISYQGKSYPIKWWNYFFH